MLYCYAFFCIVIINLVFQIKCETGNANHGPAPVRELFAYNDKEYYFYSDRVSWDEANAICVASEMHLAILDDSQKAKFISESISEAWQVFDSLWIGGQKIDNFKWTWTLDGKIIPEEQQLVGNYSFLYPPWIDDVQPNRDGKDCLAVDRNGHNDPFFVDLNCKLPRSFICESNNQLDKTEPWVGKIVQVSELEYILYHGRLSWQAAVSFCRHQGYSLATVENMQVARKLTKNMLKSRPEFEDMWIGATYKHDKWVWVENGEDVRSISAELKPGATDDTNEDNVITPAFPPWFQGKPRKNRNCAVLDRHLCKTPKFIDLKCNRQRDFACIKRTVNVTAEIPPIVQRKKKKRYTIHNVQATWIEGKKLCEDKGENTTMLVIHDENELRYITQTMAEAKVPINHVWLAGHLLDDGVTWIWDANGNHNFIPLTSNEDGFPPWCDNDTSSDMACLNLDRQNIWTPLIYGLECNATQAVICVEPTERIDRKVVYPGSGPDDPKKKLWVTKIQSRIVSPIEAEEVCKKNVGRLWQPNFSKEESLKSFFKNLIKYGNETYKGVYHIDGGRYGSKIKMWIRMTFDGRVSAYGNLITEWPPTKGDCLVVNVNETTEHVSYQPVQCHHHFISQVICEPACPEEEISVEDDKSEWICDSRESDLFEVKLLGTSCKRKCDRRHALQGPERYTCRQTGWLSNQQHPFSASRCVALKSAFKIISDVAIKKKPKVLAFILDGTKIGRNFDAIKLLTGFLLDKIITSTKRRAAGGEISAFVTVMEGELMPVVQVVNAKYNFKKTNVCDFIIKNVINKTSALGDGNRDFGAALRVTKNVLMDYNLEDVLIVLMAGGSNQLGSFKQAAREINKHASVFTVGLNKHAKNDELLEIATRDRRNNSAYNVHFVTTDVLITAIMDSYASCTACKCKAKLTSMIHLNSSTPKKHPAKDAKIPADPVEDDISANEKNTPAESDEENTPADPDEENTPVDPDEENTPADPDGENTPAEPANDEKISADPAEEDIPAGPVLILGNLNKDEKIYSGPVLDNTSADLAKDENKSADPAEDDMPADSSDGTQAVPSD